jgi:hypothetical protein
LALAHNLRASLSPPELDDAVDDSGAFGNEKDADGAGAELLLVPNEKVEDVAAGNDDDEDAGALLVVCPKDNAVIGATVVALAPNEKEGATGAEAPFVRSIFAKGFLLVVLVLEEESSATAAAGRTGLRLALRILRPCMVSLEARENTSGPLLPAEDDSNARS